MSLWKKYGGMLKLSGALAGEGSNSFHSKLISNCLRKTLI